MLTKEEYDYEMKMYKIGHRLNPPQMYTRAEKVAMRLKAIKEEKKLKLKEKKKKMLSFREGKFIQGMSKGLNKKDSAIYAGYSPLSAGFAANRLLKSEKIISALEKAGLSDEVLANTIKVNMEAGTGIKATADTSLKAVELALKLKGHLQSEDKGDLTQNNIYINELKQLSDDDLVSRMKKLQKELT